MKHIRLLIGIAIVLSVSFAVFAASPLETYKWRVKITPDGYPVEKYIDKITFENNNFNSAVFARKEFLSAPYSSEKEDEAIVWAVKQTSRSNGKISWQGKLEGNSLTGFMTWTNHKGETTQYSLNGTPIIPKKDEDSEAEPSKTSTTKALALKDLAEAESTGAKKTPASKGIFSCSFIPFNK